MATENNHCWYNLNLDINDLILPIELFTKTPSFKIMITYQPEELFTRKWLRILSNLNFHIDDIMVFFKPEYLDTKMAHIDMKPTLDKETTFAFNYVINKSRNSQMKWYKSPKKEVKIFYTTSNTPYQIHPVSELTEIDRRVDDDCLFIVRTEVPHTVVVDKEPRWSFSVRGFFERDDTWESVINLLRDKKIIFER